MKKEIERKFLVEYLPNLENVSAVKIEQSYLSLNPEIRIRREGNKYFYTEKSEGTLVRNENNQEINKITYLKLKEKKIGNIIYKTRYKLQLKNELVAEIDIYEDYLEGLMVVEVEFPNLKEAKDFVIPPYFGKEITKDKKFKNKNLSQINSLDELKTKTLIKRMH